VVIVLFIAFLYFILHVTDNSYSSGVEIEHNLSEDEDNE